MEQIWFKPSNMKGWPCDLEAVMTMWPGSGEFLPQGKNQGQLWTKSLKTPVKTYVQSWKSFLVGWDLMETPSLSLWWKDAVGPAFRADKTHAKVESLHSSRPSGTKITIFRIQSSELDPCSSQDLTLFCWSSLLCWITGLLAHEVIFRGDTDMWEITEG